MKKAIKGNKIYEINFIPWWMPQMNVDDFFKKKIASSQEWLD